MTNVCLQIGFTRDGLEALLRKCEFKLLSCMETLHQVFLAQFFVSLPNVEKLFPQKSDDTRQAPPFPLSILAMNEPLRRCPKCTLVPPCSHISMAMLYDKIQRMRKLYPKQDPIASSPSSAADLTPICPSFLRFGVCRNIQSLGRCRYAHPLNLHTVDTSSIVKRCRVHTLPVPCMHCENLAQLHQQLRSETTKCTHLEAQVRALRKQFSDLEIAKFLFVRDHAKTTKWGSQKKDYDDKLAHFEAQQKTIRLDIDAATKALAASQATREGLEKDARNGKSHGTLATFREQQVELVQRAPPVSAS